MTTATACPFCRDVGKCISVCRNPQNVGSPELGPTLELSAPSAVATQLEALHNNSTPRANHGLAVVRVQGERAVAVARLARASAPRPPVLRRDARPSAV